MKYPKNSEIVIDLAKEKSSKPAIICINTLAFSKFFRNRRKDKWINKMSLEIGSEKITAD